MYDYFEILGIPPGAGAAGIRAAERRHPRAVHPDFEPAPAGAAAADATVDAARELSDVALDFVDMTAIVTRMRAAFFASRV